MAPKRNAREPTPSSTGTTQSSSTAASTVPSIPTKASIKASNNQSPQAIALGIWQNYLDTTPQRTKLIDVFMAFLVVVGVLQFVYCVIAGNYVCSLIQAVKDTNTDTHGIAIQCFSLWLLCNGGTIRFDRYVLPFPKNMNSY